MAYELSSSERKEVAGQAAMGAASGAAAGAAAGSVVPGIGTAIGAGVGAIGGFVSSWIGGKQQQIEQNKIEAAEKKAAQQAQLGKLASAAMGSAQGPTTMIQADHDIMSTSQSNTPGPSGYDAWKMRTYGG